MSAATRSPLWTAEALVGAAGGSMARAFSATGVSIDTRTLRAGDLFVALVAERDGHAHVRAALAAGAAGVMVHDAASVPDGAPALVVADTLAGLGALGRAGRARFRGQVVAVTGSVGKTTVKEMLRVALAPSGPVHAAQASYNNHWGVPLTLALLPADAAYCIVEIGMNNPGEIRPLAEMARPDVGVITAIAAAHIGHMGSLEAIAAEKATLLEALGAGGTAVLPQDSPYYKQLRAHAACAALTFGEHEAADARLIAAGPVRAAVGGTPVTFDLRAAGAHMAVNAMAVLAAAMALGVDVRAAARGLGSFVPGPGRGLQRRIVGDQVLLLDESYNASSASVRAALAVLGQMPARRRLAVLGDMLELGAFGEAEHAGLAPDVAKAADLLYACGPLTRSLFDRVPPALRAAHAGSAEELAPIVAAAIRPGDAVLVKGSLGSRMRVVVTALDAVGVIPQGPG